MNEAIIWPSAGIELHEAWKRCKTTILDRLLPSWLDYRTKLNENVGEYAKFLQRLKREQAIETGVLENLYRLDRGVTTTLINEGFREAYVPHGSTNIPTPSLINFLQDHENALDFVYDFVKKKRELTAGFIKELHAWVTRSQSFTHALDAFGRLVEIPLIKGDYKKNDNNPARSDGTVVRYCPPLQVEPQMDALVKLYQGLEKSGVHVAVRSAWLHHAFTQIHPFQDGNGRVARLLASLVFVKEGLFPLRIGGAENKATYIAALESADANNPQALVALFCERQREDIEKALGITEKPSGTKKLAQILAERNKIHTLEKEVYLDSKFQSVVDYCGNILENHILTGLELAFEARESNDNNAHFFAQQIVEYAKQHDYYFNKSKKKAWVQARTTVEEMNYCVTFSLHAFGYESDVYAIGYFFEQKIALKTHKDKKSGFYNYHPGTMPPFVFSLNHTEIKNLGLDEYMSQAFEEFLVWVLDN